MLSSLENDSFKSRRQKEISGNILSVVDFYVGAKDEGERELRIPIKRSTKLCTIYIK